MLLATNYPSIHKDNVADFFGHRCTQIWYNVDAQGP